jgi:thiamine pyrophosphate-dependent acetolactate synthase large subunit-like protein
MDMPNIKTHTVTGARALVDALLREGIDHVFGIPGRRISRSSMRCETRRRFASF